MADSCEAETEAMNMLEGGAVMPRRRRHMTTTVPGDGCDIITDAVEQAAVDKEYRHELHEAESTTPKRKRDHRILRAGDRGREQPLEHPAFLE